MTGRTSSDNTGHVRGTERTDNNLLKGLSVRCPVRPTVRPTRKQIREAREAYGVMLGLGSGVGRLPRHGGLVGSVRSSIQTAPQTSQPKVNCVASELT